MKTILCNLLSVMRRFKMATTLNILGLSVAFAAFMVILMQLDFDYNFDRMYENSDRIYRVELVYDGVAQTVISRPMGDFLFQSSPHIVAGSIVDPWHQNRLFTIEQNGVRNHYQETMNKVYPSFMDIFPFEMVDGLSNSLEEPQTALIPLSLAKKFFGNESAMDKALELGDNKLTIKGIYKDFPANSVVQNAIYVPFEPQENLQSWGNSNYHIYIRVDAPENSHDLIDNFKKQLNAMELGDNAWVKQTNYRLTVLPDIHYTTDTTYDHTLKSSRQVLWVLLSIAIVIIVIAGINFTNFSTALTPMRIKSINTQKVLGGDETTIRRSLLGEAVVISLLSFLIALGLVHVANLTRIASLVEADITLAVHPLIVGGTALIALLTGLLAGAYPSRYMTSFPPALVLKGSFGLSPKGRLLRNLLIGIQFIASFALIIGASFMYLQNRYMHNSPLGYDRDALIVTDINGKINQSRETFASQVKSFAGVENVTFAEPLLSSQDQYMGWGRHYKDIDIQFQCLPVDASFMDILGIQVTEGRGFRKDDEQKRWGALIFNERARTHYNLELGAMVDSMEIIGFMPDIKFASFRTEVKPMAFYVWGEQNWGSSPRFAYIKVKGGSDMQAVMDHIGASLKAIDPDYPFNVRFYDDVLDRMYQKERNLSALITLFSLIAIFISIVGVFGLVVFDSEYRKKEIGIRKVLGSTTEEILILFNKTYVRILCLCFALAAPVAYYAIYRWLENFAYKTPIYWWVFLISFAIIAFITILTVTFQNWWTANENPVKSIKTE